jgi:hypothetical protein
MQQRRHRRCFGQGLACDKMLRRVVGPQTMFAMHLQQRDHGRGVDPGVAFDKMLRCVAAPEFRISLHPQQRVHMRALCAEAGHAASAFELPASEPEESP